MKEFNIEKEIEVVEKIIKLLKDCLAISLKHRRKEECKSTLKDIRICEIELQRLVLIRAAKEKATADKAKEPAKGNAV
jgi:hypothetical protein